MVGVAGRGVGAGAGGRGGAGGAGVRSGILETFPPCRTSTLLDVVNGLVVAGRGADGAGAGRAPPPAVNEGGGGAAGAGVRGWVGAGVRGACPVAFA